MLRPRPYGGQSGTPDLNTRVGRSGTRSGAGASRDPGILDPGLGEACPFPKERELEMREVLPIAQHLISRETLRRPHFYNPRRLLVPGAPSAL